MAVEQTTERGKARKPPLPLPSLLSPVVVRLRHWCAYRSAGMDEAAEKAARKAAKKARKAERRAAAAAAGEAPDDATVPEPSKKQKKRAAEGAAGEAAEAAAAAAHNAPAAAGQPVLSGKKAKKAARNGAGDVAQDGAAPGVQVMSSVGDRDAAASGPRLRKRFYVPCPELASLSAQARGSGAACKRALTPARLHYRMWMQCAPS